MKQFLHRIPIGRKFMLVLLLPMLAMAYFAVSGIIERQQTASNMAHLQSLTGLARQAGNLIHEIQRERGMTAGFLGSEGRQFRDALKDQRQQTRQQTESFHAYLESLDTASLNAGIAARVDAVRQRLTATRAMHQRVDGLSVPTAEAIDHYTGINSALMGLVGQLGHTTRQASVSQRLSAYYNLLEAKDLAGIERALLANAFAADRISPTLYQRFMTLIGEEAAFQESFHTQASETMRARFNEALSGREIERVTELRELVVTRAAQGGFGVDSQQWFDWQTVKIGRLKSVEDAVAEEVLATAEALRHKARRDLLEYALITVLAGSLALLLAILIVRSILLPLKRTLEEISSRGSDLTHRLAVPGSDELSQLYQAFNVSTTGTEKLVSNIRHSALSVELASGEIAQGNQDLAQRTEEQSASLVETASSMEQITATVRQTADNAQQAHAMSEEVTDQADRASDVASQARDAMTRIREANQQVTAIVSAIDGIAFQTNLLALNAAVEAARAGEHGRGFAVVASEVRKLASRSSEEAARIRQLVDRNVASIDEGDTLVSATSDTLETIAARVKQMAALVHDISAAATEQSAGVEQINQAVAQLEEVTQQNAALVEQIAAASKSLDGQAGDMSGMIGQFRVSDMQSMPALGQDNAASPGRTRALPEPTGALA